MLKLTASGNLGRDCEMRYSNDGKAIITFSFASNQSERNAEGEYVDVSYWVRVITAPRTEGQTKYIQDNAVKGAKVTVMGTLKDKPYVPKDGGEPRPGLEVAFPDVIEFGSRVNGTRDTDNESEAEKPRAAAGSAKSSNGSARTPARHPSNTDDDSELNDLPF